MVRVKKALFAVFHVYRAAWTPVLGEELTAEREPGNSDGSFAVRLKRGGETVGHVIYSKFVGCLFIGALRPPK